MHLWITIMIFGNVVGTQGPFDWPEDYCREVIAGYPQATHDPKNPVIVDGREVTPDDVTFDCVWSDQRPTGGEHD